MPRRVLKSYKKPKKNPVIKVEYQKECLSCGNLFKTYSTFSEENCSKCISFVKRSENKKKALDYKGNKCIKCGYNKSEAALVFHHFLGYTVGEFTEEEKNKYKKSFEISNKLTASWETIRKELDKCVTLCSNCHIEVHNKVIEITKEELDLDCKTIVSETLK